MLGIKRYGLMLTCCLSLMSMPTVAEDKVYILQAEQWNVPRQASSLLSMPGLREAVQAYETTPNGRFVIQHPQGEEGTLWAHELRGWLVSLGIASKDIDIMPGAGPSNQLEMRIQPPSLNVNQ